MPRVAVLDDYQGVALEMANWSALPSDCQVQVFRDHLTDLAALAERLSHFEIVTCMRERTPFRRDLLERLPNLRLLVTTGMRNAAIDLAAATDLGILVCGTAGGPDSPPAELTWGLILALVRHIPREDVATRAGHWGVSVGMSLEGKVLGILGLGRLGTKVARVGVAFDMSVIAWSQNLTAERAAQCGATLVTKDELFARSDILSIHVQLSARTRGLVGARELRLDEAHRLSHQYGARPHCGRSGSRAGAPDAHHRGCGSGRLRPGTLTAGPPADVAGQYAAGAPHRLRDAGSVSGALSRHRRKRRCLSPGGAAPGPQPGSARHGPQVIPVRSGRWKPVGAEGLC